MEKPVSKHRFEKYVRLALAGGAKEAKLIPARQVTTREWVRLKCQFGCNGFNRRLCCPPCTPTPEQMKRIIAEYRHALIYSYTCTPREYKSKRLRMQRLVTAIERRMFLDGHYQAFGLTAGPCRRCVECNRDGLCRHPYDARPAMEACGIDVYATARGAGIELDVVTRRDARTKHVNLILIE